MKESWKISVEKSGHHVKKTVTEKRLQLTLRNFTLH